MDFLTGFGDFGWFDAGMVVLVAWDGSVMDDSLEVMGAFGTISPVGPTVADFVNEVEETEEVGGGGLEGWVVADEGGGIFDFGLVHPDMAGGFHDGSIAEVSDLSSTKNFWDSIAADWLKVNSISSAKSAYWTSGSVRALACWGIVVILGNWRWTYSVIAVWSSSFSSSTITGLAFL